MDWACFKNVFFSLREYLQEPGMGAQEQQWLSGTCSYWAEARSTVQSKWAEEPWPEHLLGFLLLAADKFHWLYTSVLSFTLRCA